MPIEEKVYFEHLYKEYEALNTRIDSYSFSAFEDFKLLAAVGSMFAWEPFWKQFNLGTAWILLLGFCLIAGVIAIIECQNLLKLSLIRYYMKCLGEVERELLILAERGESPSFHVSRNFEDWLKKHHGKIIAFYKKLLYGTIVVFPAAIMFYLFNERWEGCVTVNLYLLVSIPLFVKLYRLISELYENKNNKAD